MSTSAIVLAVLAVPVLSGCSALEEPFGGDSLVTLGCDDLADEAVRISGEEEALIELLKVRNPRTVTDNRESYETPSGDDEALVLKCEGTGVWSDGSNSPVVLTSTVDSDGDTWVAYEGK